MHLDRRYWLLTAGAIIAGALLIFLISDTVTRPLASLVKGVHALERGDMAALGRAAHSLKGSSANMCASSTSEAAARLESAARAGGAEDVAKLEMQLRAETRRAIEYLRARQG